MECRAKFFIKKNEINMKIGNQYNQFSKVQGPKYCHIFKF